MAERLNLPEPAIRHLRRWYRPDLLESTAVLRGTILGWLFGRLGQDAVTVNGSVHLTSRASGLDSDRGIGLIGHELFHVVQQQEMGWWRFFVRYVLAWRPVHVMRGRGHPMERPAYERGDAIMASLRE